MVSYVMIKLLENFEHPVQETQKYCILPKLSTEQFYYER